MRCGGWVVGCLVGGFGLVGLSGCVSLDGHLKLRAAHRNLTAEQQALQRELFDVRHTNESLRTRVDSLSRERQINEDLASNLRRENELLDEIRQKAQSELERIANWPLRDIAIAGPKLPEPLHYALKQFADEHPSAVVYDAPHGTVKWKADLLFPLGNDVVKQTSKKSLQRFTQIMMLPAATAFEVIVVGHTDNRPIVRRATKEKHPTNWHLSAHRAIAVGIELRKYGYAPERISVMGFGEYRPVADNQTEKGSSQNRRVEIYIVPKGTIVATSDAAGRSSGSAHLGTP